MIALNNGIHVGKYLLDPKKTVKGFHNLISHAHSDHLPYSFGEEGVFCSHITKRMIRIRKNKNVRIRKNENVQLLNAGHALGSVMFYLKEHDLLYTGDFNTVPKYCGYARPNKCKTLIIESTYGKPKYVFPSYEETVKALIDYLEENQNTVIHSYSFGKAQELCYLLNKHNIEFSVAPDVKRINERLKLRFRLCNNRKKNIIVGNLQLRSCKHIICSGWALDRDFRYTKHTDMGFPLSDHADFNAMIRFVKQCDPENVYTVHGFNDVLAAEIREQLGINAAPLNNKQATLCQYF